MLEKSVADTSDINTEETMTAVEKLGSRDHVSDRPCKMLRLGG